MPGVGLEPTRITPADFKSAASANSATPAKIMEATTGFEPVYRGFADPRLNHLATSPLLSFLSGAEDEIRTRDPLLGKEMLYH